MLEPQAKTQQLYLLLCTHSCKGLCHRINFGLTVITAVTQSESVKAAFLIVTTTVCSTMQM